MTSRDSQRHYMNISYIQNRLLPTNATDDAHQEMELSMVTDDNPLMLLQTAAKLVDQDQKNKEEPRILPKSIIKNPNDQDSSRERDINRFRLAAASGDLETLNILLTVNQIHPGVMNNVAIIEAAKNGHLSIVKRLLSDHRTNPADQRNYAVRMAVRYGHLEILELFLKHPKIDTAADNNYPIRIASINGYTDIVKLLLKNPKVDPTVKDNYPVRYASKNHHWDIVELLLKDHRVDSQQVLNSARKNARLFSHLIDKLEKRIALFVNQSSSLTVKQQTETKPLQPISPVPTEPRLSPTISEKSPSHSIQEIVGLAARGKINAIAFLLSEHKGFFLSNVNKAIVSAAEHGHLEVIKYLVREYPQSNLHHDDNAPLKKAQQNNHGEVAKFLLSHDASSSSK